MIDCSNTREYFAEKAKMVKLTDVGVCEIKCANCPLSEKNNGKGRLCVDYEMHHPEEAISIVQRWSNANSQKTYLSKLLKYFPNTELDKYGAPKRICPHHLGLHDMEGCKKNYSCACIECWNQALPEREENE